MRHAQYVRGGTVPAVMDPTTGKLVQAKQTEASINITFNYGRYYYEATDGDIRFAHDVVSAYYADGTKGPTETEYGLPGLDGTTLAESIPMLMDMVERISKKYKDKDSLNWITTEREKRVYFKNGKELKNISIEDILHKQYDEVKHITYQISEGDMSNYWTATADNAIKPLLDMIVMATDNLTEKDVVWKVSY